MEIPYLDDYIKHMKIIEMASPYTLKNYPIHLKHFFEYTKGKYNVNIITLKKYTYYLLEDKKYARATVNAKLSSLRSYYHYLYNTEIINTNIAEKIELLDLEEKEKKRLPTQDKIFKVLDIISDLKDRALLETLYCTGIRESELSNLDISHVDFENKFITIFKGKGKKGGKTRVIPISNTALKWIKAYLGSRKEGPLFLNNRYHRMGTRGIYNIVYKYFGFPPHDLRHCFATHMLKKTGNLKGVSEMLGHSSTQMTEKIYTHFNVDDLKDIYGQGGMDR